MQSLKNPGRKSFKSDEGSGIDQERSLKLWWRWRELNPRPAILPVRRLHA